MYIYIYIYIYIYVHIYIYIYIFIYIKLADPNRPTYAGFFSSGNLTCPRCGGKCIYVHLDR